MYQSSSPNGKNIILKTDEYIFIANRSITAGLKNFNYCLSYFVLRELDKTKTD